METLPEYQRSTDMGMVPAAMRLEKTPQADLKMKTSTCSPKPPGTAMPFKSAEEKPCFHCDQPGHRHFNCPYKNECLRCKTKDHAYWAPGVCGWRKDVQKKFSVDKKQVKAMSAVAQESSVVAALQLELEQLRAALKEVNRKKRIFLDSGANTSIISDLSHTDPHSSTSLCRAEEPRGVETANGSIMPIVGMGQIAGVTGVICPESSFSLVSVPQVARECDATFVINESEAFAYKNSPDLTACVNDIKDTVTSNHTMILAATRSPESLYEITTTPVVFQHTPSTEVLMSSSSGALKESLGAVVEPSGEADVVTSGMTCT